MPLVYQQNINDATKIAVWKITESEIFFLQQVPLQREIRHVYKRLQHLAGRLLLKKMYPEFPVAIIRTAESKKPYLEEDPFHFSISHCSNYAAAIVSKKNRVGVDVELPSAKVKNIIPKFLTVEESSLLPAALVMQTATLFWSVKETIYKWHSTPGLDFKKDMLIQSITGNTDAGTVEVKFQSKRMLKIEYVVLQNIYLTWILTDH